MSAIIGWRSAIIAGSFSELWIGFSSVIIVLRLYLLTGIYAFVHYTEVHSNPNRSNSQAILTVNRAVNLSLNKFN